MRRSFAVFARLFYTLSKPVSAVLLHNSHRVRVFIQFQDRVLLQRSSFGHQQWSVPGGGVEKREKPLHAALREVKEEVGIVLEEEDLLCIGEKRVVSGGKHFPKVNLILYVVHVPKQLSPEITRAYEILEAKWFKLNELPKNRSKTVDLALSHAKKGRL